MPVYNARRYLPEALQSILRQTFRNFEFLIIDDGSTDGSLDVLQRYAERDSRIRLITRERRGLVATRNQALEIARSPLIACMDADDVAIADRLEVQVAFLEAHKDVVCLSGYYDLMDQRGRFLTTMDPPTEHAEIEKEALAGHTPICQSGAMMRRAVALSVGGYDPELMLAEDLDLWLKLGEVGRLANLAQPIHRYRLHGQSVSGQAGATQRRKAYEACRNAWRRRGIEGRFEATEPARPQTDRRSRHKFALLYGWWAFNSGQRRTAIIYGLKCLGLMPWNKEGLRLLICAAIKSPAGSTNAELAST